MSKTYGDWVSVTKEGLDLFLVVDVPDSDNSVFAPTYKIFTTWGDSWAEYFITVALMLSIKLHSPEEVFLSCLNVPYFKMTELKKSKLTYIE